MTENNFREGIKLTFSDEGKLIEKPLGPKKKVKPINALVYIGFMGNVGMSIVVPVVLGALIGNYLDIRFGSHPKAVLIGIGIGFILSLVNVIVTVKSFIQVTRK